MTGDFAVFSFFVMGFAYPAIVYQVVLWSYIIEERPKGQTLRSMLKEHVGQVVETIAFFLICVGHTWWLAINL